MGLLFFGYDGRLSDSISYLFFICMLSLCVTLFRFSFRWIAASLIVAGIAIMFVSAEYLLDHLSRVPVATMLLILGIVLPTVVIRSFYDRFVEKLNNGGQRSKEVPKVGILIGSFIVLV